MGRVAVRFGAGQGASAVSISLPSRPNEVAAATRPVPKRTQPARREAEGTSGGVARSLQPAAGMRLARSLPSAPSASTRDPLQSFNRLLMRCAEANDHGFHPAFARASADGRGLTDKDASLRIRQVKIIGKYAITYWLDDPVKSVMVVAVHPADR